jgi:GntR family transcriptional regulator
MLDADGRIVYYAHIQYPAQMIQIETDLMQGRKKPAQKSARAVRAVRRRTG